MLPIAILDFSLLLPIQISLFQLCDSKSCRSYSIALVGRVITLEREPSKKKQRTRLIQKRMQRGLRVITLQGAIEKSPILEI